MSAGGETKFLGTHLEGGLEGGLELGGLQVLGLGQLRQVGGHEGPDRVQHIRLLNYHVAVQLLGLWAIRSCHDLRTPQNTQQHVLLPFLAQELVPLGT